MTFTTDDCAAVCAQLSHAASFDVRGFDAASDVPPTQLHSHGKRKRERFLGQRCIEKTQPPCQRETHSVTQVISIADAGDRKCEWASCIQA